MAGGSLLHDKKSTSATGPDDFAGRRGKGILLWRTKCPALVVVSMVVALLAAVGQPAQAGGPKYVAGVSYFNSGTLGTPLTWAQGSINYYTDQGDLSQILP